jgi:hypothetical protein
LTKIQKNLAVIHWTRTVLVLSLPVAFDIEQSYIMSQFMMDMIVVIRTGSLGLIVLVVLLEIIYSKQLAEEKMESLLFPFGLMIAAVLIELVFASSLRYIDGLMLGIHVNFVIGLSAVEAGLIVIHYTRDSP